MFYLLYELIFCGILDQSQLVTVAVLAENENEEDRK